MTWHLTNTYMTCKAGHLDPHNAIYNYTNRKGSAIITPIERVVQRASHERVPDPPLTLSKLSIVAICVSLANLSRIVQVVTLVK